MANTSLNTSKVLNNNEFYTLLSDVEAECGHYEKHFKGKVVLCNCDDPFQSNFVKYFMLKFKKLGLKQLISTCYKSQNADLFSRKDSERAVYMVYNGEQKGNMPDWDARQIFPLKGDGDFRSEECINLLKASDIVATNPPFGTEFEDFIKTLLKYEKKFLIIGNQNALHYSYMFPKIAENKIWLGYNYVKCFATPLERVEDPKKQYMKDGVVYQKFGNVCWFTNLDHDKRHEELVLYKKYSCDEYKHYYNFDGIDVPEISKIPVDYDGLMGVPDTLIASYNPEQFELIGVGSDVTKTAQHIAYKKEGIICYVRDGQRIWTTPYTVSERKLGNGLRLNDNGQPGSSPFSRIIVRLKHPQDKRYE